MASIIGRPPEQYFTSKVILELTWTFGIAFVPVEEPAP